MEMERLRNGMKLMAKAVSNGMNVKSFLDLLNSPALRDTARH